MKIVDKYELAKMPFGTPFYVLDEWGNIGKGCEQGLLIQLGNNFVDYDGKPMFNGVCYLEPDTDNYGHFTEETLPNTFNLFSVDTDSNDFNDKDKFLVLNAKELKIIIDYLQKCYENIKENWNCYESNND